MSGNDTPMTRFLFAILQQKSLKDIDWNKVAHDPILAQEITNGHAARMRYSRFRTYMLNLEPRRRNRDPNAKNKVSKPKKDPKVKREGDPDVLPVSVVKGEDGGREDTGDYSPTTRGGLGGGLASVKQDPDAPQGPAIKHENVATLSAAASAAAAATEAGEPTQHQHQPTPSQFTPYNTTTTARFAHSPEEQISVSMAATQQQNPPQNTTSRLLTPASDAGDIHHHYQRHQHHQLALNPHHPAHNHHSHMPTTAPSPNSHPQPTIVPAQSSQFTHHLQQTHTPSVSASPGLTMSPTSAWRTPNPVGGIGMTAYAPSNFDAAFDSMSYGGVCSHQHHGHPHDGHVDMGGCGVDGGGNVIMEGVKQEGDWQSHFSPV